MTMTGTTLQTGFSRRLPPRVAGENDIVLIEQYRTGKAELLDAFDQPADLFCRMGSDVVRMALQGPPSLNSS